MASCSSYHKCRKANGILPSRVLSIGSPVIQLRDTSGEPGSYAALSHCWGNHPSLTTTIATLDLHKHEIKWELLGRTYQDAVVLTRSLGLDFLWVDSLCIIQDSVADWEVQSAHMADIYLNATITIAASKAADGSVGFFTDHSKTPYIWRRGGYNIDVSANYRRSDSDLYQCPYVTVEHHDQWKPLPIHVSPQKTFWMGLEPTHEVLEHRRRRPPADIVGLGMPLFTRAWFLQERLMSPRIIHFGAMELYWECDHGMVCECLEDDINRHYSEATARRLYSSLIRHSTTQNQTTTRPFSSETEQSVLITASELDAWHKMVEEYSRLLLTREMDRLPALSGIANMLGNSYLAGIWTDYLPRCLYWTPDTTCNASIRRPFDYRAPSFSWASIEGPVNYHNWFSKLILPSTQIGHVVAAVVDKSSTVEGLDPSGRVKNGYVTLLGYSGLATVIKVYIYGTTTRCDICRGKMVQSFQLDIPICLGRTEPTEVQQGDRVMVLLLECVKREGSYYVNEHGAYQLSALVLKPESPDSSSYRRVGLIGPVSETKLESGVDGTVPRRLDSLYTNAPDWFDKKREIRLV